MKNIVSIVMVVAAIGIFFAYVKPSYGNIKIQRTELASYNDTLEQAKMLEAKVKELQAKVGSLDPEGVERVEKLLPDTISNVNLIIDISNIAKNSNNLLIRNIQLQQGSGSKASKETTSKGTLYDSIDLTFNVTASYGEFLAFASNLEHSLRLVDITNVSFSPTDTADKYAFKVTVRTYWLK